MKRIVALLVSFLLIAAIAIFVADRANAKTTGVSWQHSKGHWPYVVVEKHSSHFPVITAAKRWGTPFHVGRCASHPNQPCVKVYSKNYGDNGTTSTTAWSTWPGTNHFAMVVINLNSYYGWQRNSAYRLQAVEHELGHAVGLDHDTSGGVMQSGCDGNHTSISAYERRELRNLYGM